MGSDSAYGEKFFETPPKRKKEKCVSCGKETNVFVDTHIDLRKHYVEGAGQLCDDCGEKLYN